MTDRQRLLKMLKAIARRPKPRSIVCYDHAWAGIPRITIYDRPRRRKARRIKGEWAALSRPVIPPQPRQLQLPLDLTQSGA